MSELQRLVLSKFPVKPDDMSLDEVIREATSSLSPEEKGRILSEHLIYEASKSNFHRMHIAGLVRAEIRRREAN